MQNFGNAISDNAVSLGGKSWIAYVSPVFFCVVFLALCFFLMSLGHQDILLGAIGVIIVACFTIYSIMNIQSYHMFYDENGIWLYSGVFPWSRGYRCIKWRDLDCASFQQNFFSWMFQSYTVSVLHRFQPNEHIILTQMLNGNKASGEINSQLQGIIRNQNIS